MIRSQYQITVGRQYLHQKARLRGATMEAVGKNDDGLFNITKNRNALVQNLAKITKLKISI